MKKILLWLLLILSANLSQTHAQEYDKRKNGEWPAYGGDPGGMRHAALSQITSENVS